MDFRGLELEWRGHATVTVKDDGFTLAVDPFDGYVPESADLVLVTHADEGHFDRQALEDVCSRSTCLVVPESMESMDLPCRDVEYIREGELLEIFSVEIEAVPMYNQHHERGQGFGYRFVMRDHSFYVAGDTGVFPEARELEGRVDLAFMPVDGVFTMDEDEAVQLAARIRPDIVVPYHYGEPFFSDVSVDLEAFESEIEDRSMECRILDS